MTAAAGANRLGVFMPPIRVAAAVTAFVVAATAIAHDAAPSKAERAIDYRHSVYHVIGWNVAPMGDAVGGKIPFNKDVFAMQAARVAALAPMLPEGFPDGSYVKGKTEAKPEIWTNRAEFEELMKRLADKSAALAEIAKSGDLAKIKPAFTDLTQVCKSCHDKFREKD